VHVVWRSRQVAGGHPLPLHVGSFPGTSSAGSAAPPRVLWWFSSAFSHSHGGSFSYITVRNSAPFVGHVCNVPAGDWARYKRAPTNRSSRFMHGHGGQRFETIVGDAAPVRIVIALRPHGQCCCFKSSSRNDNWKKARRVRLWIYSFPGSAWERTASQALPAV